MSLADSIAKIAAAVPMTQGGPVAGRVLLADGDGLAYSCSGSDHTDPGQARENLITKVRAAMRASAASDARILLTSPTSNKGYRYAIARVKPYQGHRSSSRRPRNWAYLRSLLETSALPFTVIQTDVAEADDLFGSFVTEWGPEACVHYSEDKDIRMLPGYHLNWETHALHRHKEADYASEAWGKVFGTRWFFLQLLQGDPTDNIPGLPHYVVDGKQKLCGPKTAEGFVSSGRQDQDLLTIIDLYRSYYGAGWGPELLEQACLLWMRRCPWASYLDVVAPGRPLECLQPYVYQIVRRVEEARTACSS